MIKMSDMDNREKLQNLIWILYFVLIIYIIMLLNDNLYNHRQSVDEIKTDIAEVHFLLSNADICD